MNNSNPLEQLRKNVGLTRAELAEVVGVAENTIANWEKKKEAPEWIQRLYRLCKTLNCTVNDLYSETESEINPPSTISGATLETVRRYCQARINNDHKTQARIASHAALDDKELHYWISSAEIMIKEAEVHGGKISCCDWLMNCLMLKKLVHELNPVHPTQTSLEQFKRVVEQVKLDDFFIEEKMNLDMGEPDTYQRILIMQTWSLTVYIINWGKDGICGLHHHGDSLDAIYVVKGVMQHGTVNDYKEIPYGDDGLEKKNIIWNKDEKIRNEDIEIIPAGQFAFVDRRQGHQIRSQSDQNLLTVHFRFGVAPDDNKWVPGQDREQDETLSEWAMNLSPWSVGGQKMSVLTGYRQS